MHSSFAYFGGRSICISVFGKHSIDELTRWVQRAWDTPVIIQSLPDLPEEQVDFYLCLQTEPIRHTGILWAYQPINGCNANNNNCHAILHAVNASDITNELWNSDMVTETRWLCSINFPVRPSPWEKYISQPIPIICMLWTKIKYQLCDQCRAEQTGYCIHNRIRRGCKCDGWQFVDQLGS